jgi:RNA polymerase sigma factor (sigma-70 family)
MCEFDERAFQEFAHIFGPRLRALFIKSGLRYLDAEDLTVSCVTDIALKVGKYRPADGGGFDAWVFTLARHSLIDWLRNHSLNKCISEELAPRVLAKDEPELIASVSDALAQMPENDRAVIAAKNFDGERTFAEVAAELGLLVGTARMRYHRALKRLQALLERD